MKKLINIAFFYAIAALAGGVFYREFTKLNGFTGHTTLAFVHTHLFILGMVMFMIVALFYQAYDLSQSKKFKVFNITYNIGLLITVIMLIVRGIIQVLEIELTNGLNAAVSGVAGIGHILLGTGIVLLFLTLKERIKTK